MGKISFFPLLSERGSSKIQNNQNPSLPPSKKQKQKSPHKQTLHFSPTPTHPLPGLVILEP
jgi:hypothetical protein